VRRLAPLALVLVLAVVSGGCSLGKPGGETVQAKPTEVQGTLPQQTTESDQVPPQYQNGDATAGKQVFETAGCKGCHTLADAGATGTVGPNLDDAKPDKDLVITRVTKGMGAMPPFAGQLTDQQIADVAAYVVQATGGS